MPLAGKCTCTVDLSSRASEPSCHLPILARHVTMYTSCIYFCEVTLVLSWTCMCVTLLKHDMLHIQFFRTHTLLDDTIRNGAGCCLHRLKTWLLMRLMDPQAQGTVAGTCHVCRH